MEEAKILGKGQLVIPAKIRKQFGLKPGDAVRVFEYGGVIHLIPASKSGQGGYRHPAKETFFNKRIIEGQGKGVSFCLQEFTTALPFSNSFRKNRSIKKFLAS